MQDMAPKEALDLLLSGIDDKTLNYTFYKPYMDNYKRLAGKDYNYTLDAALNDDGYYFYFTKEIDGRKLICALQRMAFTVGLMVNIIPEEGTMFIHKYRYCFPTLKQAFESLVEWDGSGFPPGAWLKRKGEGGDLSNPNLENET